MKKKQQDNNRKYHEQYTSKLFRFKTILNFSSVLSKDCLNISRLLSQSGFRKRSGVGVLVLFMALIESVLSGAKSLHDLYSLNYVANPECSYHALMRFISNSKHNWSLLMLLTDKAAISIIRALNNKDHINTLCVDTIIERARCKRAEGLCRTFNHVIGKTVKDYTNLLVSWNDGYTSIPVASEMLSSTKSSNVIRAYDKSIDKRSAGVRRRADSLTRKPKLLIKLCKGILNKGIDAQYVLMDTWFFSDALIAALRELSLDSICMIKKNLKFAFVGETQTKNLKQILKSTHQHSNTSQIISSVIVQSKTGQRENLFLSETETTEKSLSLCSQPTLAFHLKR